MKNYYVYYRIEPASRAELARVIQEIFAAVARETGVHGRWMSRCEDPSTCMEVYEQVRDAPHFVALLEREARLRGFERFLAPGATRHTDCFVAAED